MQAIQLKNIIGILLGTAIFSFGFVHFNMQNELGEGGFSGITLILYFTLQWEPALLNLLLNIPMFILGWRLLGKTTFIYTVVGTTGVSLFLKLFQHFEFQLNLQDDLLLVSLFAGVFIGVGLGIVFRFGGTTGGSDILARLGLKYFGWSMGKTIFGFDVLIILLSWMTFLDARSVMYTLVAVYVGGRMIDFVQEGANAAKGTFIVSEKSDEIAHAISEKMTRGVTVFDGRGYFSKKHRDVLYCVVSRNELVRLKSTIHKIDPHAFISVMDVREVAGHGFTLERQRTH